MKRCAISLLLGLWLVLPAPVRAQSGSGYLPFIQTNVYTIPEGVTVPEEQWVVAQSADVKGDTLDDLFLASGTATLRGRTGGDLWTLGQRTEILGSVGRRVRSLSQMLVVDGPVAGGLWAGGRTVSLETNAIIGGSVRVLADYFILRGSVTGNLSVVANKIVIDGTVGGTATLEANEISILGDTRIGGALVYRSPAPLTPDRSAIIEGGLRQQPPLESPKRTRVEALLTLLSFIGSVLVGVFFLLFAPRLTVRSVLWMENYPWRTLLVGLAAAVVTPFLIFFMLVSFLGIPLSLVTAAFYGLGMYLGRFVAALSLARLLTGKRRSAPVPIPSPRLMVLGLVVFFAAEFLPDHLGSAIQFWFTITGLGGLILASRSAPMPVIPMPPPIITPDTTKPSF